MIFYCFNHCAVLQKLCNIKQYWFVYAAIIALTLAGCGSQPPSAPTSTPAIETQAEPSSIFLDLANRNSGSTAEQYRLLAFKQSILNREYELAGELRDQIELSLLSTDEVNSTHLTAIALLNPQYGSPEVMPALENRVPNLADVPEWNYYMGNAQAARDNNETATQYYYSCSRLPPAQIDYRASCAEGLWEILLKSKDSGSEVLASINSDYRAWVELARLVQNNTGLIENQTQLLEGWFSAHSDHPARLNPPVHVVNLIQKEIEAPASIALVLPLSGRLQSAGEAVLDGFLSAAYLTAAQGYMAPQIEIFDSEALPIELIAEIVSSDNFDMTVGPLDAENVAAFARSVPGELTSLYLNNLPSNINRSGSHIGYSLAVESEAQQAAQTAILEGHKSALVLIEDSNIGERAAGAFADGWLLAEDRKIYDLVRLSDATTLTERLEQSFHVDQSESRMSRLQTLLGKRLEFTPRRRQDIDTIFLASNSVLARQITPTLAFLFAEDVPVLATSRVFDENSGSENNRDLETLRFLSPLWLAKAEQPLAQTVSVRPLELQKLEAMGVDAFYLSRRFQQLEDPGFSYQGKTGNIFVGDDGNLKRTMEWVRIDGEKMVSAD
jgi:outer membrane PBP1 activator LpoA protein